MDFRRTIMMKSTNKWTDIFIAFIKANRSLLIIYMLNIIVFSSVYILGRLPFYFLRFSIELSLFLGSCFFVFQFSRYYNLDSRQHITMQAG